VHEGKLSTLKRFKDEVREVQSGQECGMAFENYGDMRVGDVIEVSRRDDPALAVSPSLARVLRSTENAALMAGHQASEATPFFERLLPGDPRPS